MVALGLFKGSVLGLESRVNERIVLVSAKKSSQSGIIQ